MPEQQYFWPREESTLRGRHLSFKNIFYAGEEEVTLSQKEHHNLWDGPTQSQMEF